MNTLNNKQKFIKLFKKDFYYILEELLEYF